VSISFFNAVLLRDFALYDLLNHGYAQAIPVIKAWLVLEADKRNNTHIPDEKILEKYAQQHYSQVLDELLPLVLKTAAKESVNRYHSEWDSAGCHASTERQIVQFVQYALNQEAEKMTEQFFHRVSCLEQVAFPIKQELLLHAMEYTPLHEADKVLGWLLIDFDQHAFEDTSLESSRFTCCQRIIQRFRPIAV